MNKLFLNKSIYTQKQILDTISAFSSLCNIKLCDDVAYFICEFYNCIYEIEETKKEFENYLIDLINTSSLTC